VTYIVQKIDALKSLHPNVEIYGYDDNPIWNSNIPQPSDTEIQAEVIRLQAVYDSQEYARLRKAEYDKLNQFEMQFDDNRDGTTTWVDAVNDIKARYPK
jgi:hypothetical protein